MRDLLVFLVVFGSLPLILRKPYIGILVWSWLGYMNPHRLTWGFAYDFPFAQVVGIATLVGLLFSNEPKRFPVTGLTVTTLFFAFWMTLTTLFAFYPDLAWPKWDQTMKVLLFSFVSIVVMRDKKRINYLVWVIVVCIGFFSVKGGIFSILTGGNFRVYGPNGSFIYDNNAIGLAMVMILPLMWYLSLSAENNRVRIAMYAAIGLTVLAILTTHSRGALLAITAMFLFLWLKSRKKGLLALAMLIGLPMLWIAMPESWHERMATISTYEQDGSAMGRINAWMFAYNLASDYPILGGGFATFSHERFQIYAPDPEDFHDAHSIYFATLAEHGFVGLAIFLVIGILALLTAQKVIREARIRAELQWARDLASMIQVSLVGYAVGGLFLGLAYFDLYYHLVAMVIILRSIVDESSRAGVPSYRPHDQGNKAIGKPP